jgi:hypothetical protein
MLHMSGFLRHAAHVLIKMALPQRWFEHQSVAHGRSNELSLSASR